MPALPAVPNVIRADLYWTIGADASALNRLFIAYTGASPSNADAASLASALFTSWAAEWHPYTHTTTVATGCRVVDLSSSSGGEGLHTGSSAGADASDPLAASTCGLLSMGISRRYRGGKPRTYLPIGGADLLQTAQTWKSTTISNCQASADAFRAAVATMTAGTTDLTHLVNVSYYHGFTVVTSPTTGRARNVPTLRSTPVVDNLVTWSFEPKVASQRRRDLRQP